jgi:TRAP-type transport system periplasmic protein
VAKAQFLILAGTQRADCSLIDPKTNALGHAVVLVRGCSSLASFPERAAEQNCARQPPRLGLPGRRKTRMPISRREWLVAACAAGINVAAAGRSRSARAQSPVVLRVSTSAAVDENSAHHLWFQKFAANVKDALGDRVKFDYFPNSQLGKEADIVEQVKIGSTDLMITGSSIWATVAPELGMLDLGYMFDSYDHASKAIDNGVDRDLAKILRDRTGVSIIAWGFHFGARSVYTKLPVKQLADLKGVKLRVLPAPAFIETFKVMGAIPTPIPVNELYTALQTGVVDGYEHDPGTTISMKLYEVVKYGFLTEHLFSPMCVFLGKRGLDKIPADARPGFLRAAADATIWERGIAAAKTKSSMQELERLGITYTPMPTQERRAMQNEMATRLYAPFAEKYPATKTIFAAIAAART